MKIIKRLKTLFEARMNRVLDEAEDPEQLLDLTLQEMVDHLQQVKRSLLDVTTHKKSLEKDLADVNHEIILTQEQAETAMKLNREEIARAALGKKASLQEKQTVLANEVDKIDKKIEIIKENKRTLEGQINRLENKHEELVAINRAADAQLAVREIVTGVSDDITDLNEQITRVEEKIKQKEAKIAAIDELVAKGEVKSNLDSQDTLERTLYEIQREARIEEELKKLKAMTGGE